MAPAASLLESERRGKEAAVLVVDSKGRPLRRSLGRAAMLLGAIVAGATAFAAPADETAFLAENNAAMDRMMAAMTIKPSGDIDKDFVAMMVPHHQGAIDMAQLVLRYGRNEQIRRLAQEIIVTQQQEIAAMRLAVGEPLPSSVASPTQVRPAAPREPAASGAMQMSPGMNMR